MFSLQSFTKLPSQPEWLCERAQPPCPGMEPYGSRSSLGSAGSCLLGQEGALCWEMLHFSPQGIKQWFCKPSAPLWMDKAPYKTRELFGCCRRWHSCDSHNRLTLLSVTLESPVAFTQPLARGLCRGTCLVPTRPACAGRSTQLTWEHHPALAQDQGLEKQEAWPSLGTSK